MQSPAYRRRLQELADHLLRTLPENWQEAALRARFPSSSRTGLEVSYRSGPQSRQTPVEIPSAVTRDFAAATRAVRAELVLAGNPGCKGFVFWISKAGKSALDVEY
jgi:hypothetical protein